MGLYRGQPPILGLLYQHDGMSQKEMAGALNLSPATMTVTLKRMEKAGLVRREMDEHDQRILRVHLSEQGRQMWLKSTEQIRAVTGELMAAADARVSVPRRKKHGACGGKTLHGAT